MVSIAPIFTKLVTSRHYLNIYYTEIHPKWKRNTSIMSEKFLLQRRSMAVTCCFNADVRFSTRKNTKGKAEQQKQTREY